MESVKGIFFVNISHTCGEQFAHRSFFLFLGFVTGFKSGIFFVNASHQMSLNVISVRTFCFLFEVSDMNIRALFYLNISQEAVMEPFIIPVCPIFLFHRNFIFIQF